MTMDTIFDGWDGIIRTICVGTAAYVVLVLVLRVSGKRTLSKMNAFDLVVTVALGSTLATVLLDRSLPLVDGIVAFATLVLLQFSITWLSVRNALVRRVVKSEPTLLVHDGALLEGAMKSERVTREEIEAAMREHGRTDLSAVSTVVLETDGTLSVTAR